MFIKIAYGILFIFLSIMALVTGVAITRKSGATGHDMALIQKIRFYTAK